MSLETIQPLIDWIASHPELAGVVVFLIAFTESLALVGIVVPGIVFMLSIGTLVGLGAINLWSALVWAALGAIAGDWLSYWLGRHFDRQLRHIWPLSRYPKLIPAGERFFKRHGGKSVLFGRFVGPLRPIIPAVAGIMHMSQAKFYFMNIVSAILWAPVVIMPGVAFGSSLQMAQEVFGKLIALIVILILVGALFGYIAKKLFAYALMTTVNTWGELFGFDKARENLTSFSLASVLVIVVALFVAGYEQRYQPIATVQQATDRQWWQSNWQLFSPASAKANKFRSDFPITLQWRGELQRIKSKLQQLQWQAAKRITFENGLAYFLPEPELLTLPAGRIKLFNKEDQLIMVKRVDNEDQLYVLRLWSASARPAHPAEQLWLGVIYSVKLVSPLNLINIPLRQKDFADGIKQFSREVATSDDLIAKQKLYLKADGFETWQGEVLLLEFNKPVDNEPLPEIRQNLSTYQLKGAKKVALAIPESFTGTVDSGFNYKDNGVVIAVRRYADKNGNNLEDASSWIRQQLKNNNQAEHSPLISLQEKNLSDSANLGRLFIARYNMPFLGKELIYRVKLMQQQSQTWVATAIHKQCDPAGERSIMAMLDAIELRPIN